MRDLAENPHLALQRAILAGLTPAHVTIESESVTPWASATFSGARHSFDVTVIGENAIAAAANLSVIISGDQVSINGHVVADILLSSHQLIRSCDVPTVVIGIEALTVNAEE
jgi:hypothetical protein